MTARRILAVTWEGGGAVPPELAVVQALVERGHDVTVLGDLSLADDVAATGAAHVPWTSAPQRTSRLPEDDFLHDWEVKSPMKLFALIRDKFLCGPAELFAADVEAELQRRPVDVVVASQMMLGAQIGAEAAGVPIVLLCPNIYPLPGTGLPPLGPGLRPAKGVLGRLRDRVMGRMMERMFDGGLDPINTARTTRGLRRLDHTLDQMRLHRTLVLIEEAFDFPSTMPPTVRYCGAQLDDPPWTEHWTPPPGDEPLVLVAMSSTYQRQDAELARVATALGTLPVRGLITTGPAIDPATINAPPNVQVIRSAPHNQVLRHAAAVVTHGGHGTVAKALAADVPLLILPMGRDQNDNAARVAYHGAGLKLRRSASSGAIANALDRLLADSRFQQAAARLGAPIRANAGPSVAVEEIERAATPDRPPTETAAPVSYRP